MKIQKILPAKQDEAVTLSTPTSARRKTPSDFPDTTISAYHISVKDRPRSRLLDSIVDVESSETPSDNTAEDMLVEWRLGRMVEAEVGLPVFFCFLCKAPTIQLG